MKKTSNQILSNVYPRCCKTVIGVQCALDAYWVPQLQLTSIKQGEAVFSATYQLKMFFCTIHKEGIDLQALITDPVWAIITAKFEIEGRLLPSRPLTRLKWERVTSVYWEKLQEIHSRELPTNSQQSG